MTRPLILSLLFAFRPAWAAGVAEAKFLEAVERIVRERLDTADVDALQAKYEEALAKRAIAHDPKRQAATRDLFVDMRCFKEDYAAAKKAPGNTAHRQNAAACLGRAARGAGLEPELPALSERYFHPDRLPPPADFNREGFVKGLEKVKASRARTEKGAKEVAAIEAAYRTGDYAAASSGFAGLFDRMTEGERMDLQGAVAVGLKEPPTFEGAWSNEQLKSALMTSRIEVPKPEVVGGAEPYLLWDVASGTGAGVAAIKIVPAGLGYVAGGSGLVAAGGAGLAGAGAGLSVYAYCKASRVIGWETPYLDGAAGSVGLPPCKDWW